MKKKDKDILKISISCFEENNEFKKEFALLIKYMHNKATITVKINVQHTL